MDNTTFTAKHLQQPLGSFWEEFFSDKTLLEGWTQGLSLQSRQLDQNTTEIEQLAGVQTTPVEHIELWRPVKLVRDHETGSFYPLRFEAGGAKFGEVGTAPIHDKQFTFGSTTDHLGLVLEDDIPPNNIMFLSDSIHNPTFVWSSGVNYDVKDGVLVFVDEIAAGNKLDHIKEVDTYKQQDVYTFWAYNCTYDLKYIAEQWGYLLAYEQESSSEYNRSLWELWKARRFGLTPDTFREIIAIYTDSPRAKETEVVETLINNFNGTTTVVTDKNVYQLNSLDSPRFEEGELVPAGEFLGTRVSVLEPGKRSFIRHNLNVLPEHVDNKLLGEPGYIETNYIRFTADEAPATIEKISNLTYSPSYAKLSLSSGEFDVTVNQVHRYTQYDFTLEIDTEMLPTPGTQVGTLQIYSTTGVPWFSQPFTGSIDSVKGVTTFFTDSDDLLREQKDALEDLVEDIDRVVLITVYDDIETRSIKTELEKLRFSDKHSIAVVSYPSVSIYTDLPTEGASFTTVSKEQLLNYDMVLLNTGSGVLSTLNTDGSLKDGPTITDNEFINVVTSNLDRQIEEKRKELAEIDNDLVWLLNYVNKGAKPSDVSWLYGLCGTHGIPKLDSNTGETFYKYGSFSKLTPETVKSHEENNVKLNREYKIPEKPWASATGLGVVTREVSVPVYSKRIDVTGNTTRLETSLARGPNYVYKVANLTEA